MAELLVDVLLQVARERRGERIVQLARAGERRLGQRHRRADDLVLEDQVLGPELAEARVCDERLVGARERNDEQAELAAQPGARRVGLRVGQWTALTFRSGERFGSFVSSPPSSWTFTSSTSVKVFRTSIVPSESCAGSTPVFSRCFLT